MKSKSILELQKEILPLIRAYIGLEPEPVKYLEGAYLTREQEEFIETFLKENSRKKKIADVLAVAFQTINRKNGSVNYRYLKAQGLKGSQMDFLIQTLNSCPLILPNHRRMPSGKLVYHFEALPSESKMSFAKYSKESTEAKVSTIVLSKYGVDATTLNEFENGKPLTVKRNCVQRFSINSDFQKYYATPETSDWDKMASRSHRTYDSCKALPKSEKKVRFPGFMEFDLQSAHMSILMGAIYELLAPTRVVDWESINKAVMALNGSLKEELIPWLSTRLEHSALGYENDKEMSKDLMIRYIYETGKGTKLTKIAASTIREYVSIYSPEFASLVDYAKGMARNKSYSVLHEAITRLEQEFVVDLQCELAHAGILTYNEHDGILVPPFESELQESDFYAILRECEEKFKASHFGVEAMQMILKRVH